MRLQLTIAMLMILGSLTVSAQVASHAPTQLASGAGASLPPAKMAGVQVTGKIVARVNGAVLTDRDLVREMFAIFPYAKQHNGFPEGLEPQIRKGALDMIIFEELVYQEAKRRNIAIPPERMARAERDFRKQFPSQEVYEQFIKVELNGSQKALREKIRRSLLIETLLNAEVVDKSKVTVAQAKAFYDKNPAKFEREELFHIQSISILPPANASADILKEARQRAEDALRQAKAAKSYQDFGLLAEKLSDDDFRVNMGDHKPCGRDQLPPDVVKAALAMKPGDVSGLIQLGTAYTLFRLDSHTAAGKVPFVDVKSQVQSDLQKERVEKLRSGLGRQLRKDARIETL
jgi:peptidyl-prolyl cis-trans isomerase SurA